MRLAHYPQLGVSASHRQLALDIINILFTPKHMQVVEPTREPLEAPHFLQPDNPIALL